MPTFDPYYKWLGIRPKDQPPDHYRLLGLELFEADPDVIDASAEQRMNFINQCATGPHLAQSQRILNEIAAARLCLLNRKEKDRYDADLMLKRGQQADALKPAAVPKPDPTDAKSAQLAPLFEVRTPQANRSNRILAFSLISAALTLIVGIYSLRERVFQLIVQQPSLPDVIKEEATPSSSAPASIAGHSPPIMPKDPKAIVTPESSKLDDTASLIQPDLDELAFTQAAAPTRQALAEYRLKRIGLALGGYHHDNNAFPLTSFPNEQLDAESKLSWLVAMLPYLNQSPAYHALKVDEAWNSETNQRIAKLSVPTFMSPVLPDESQGFVGVSHFAGIAGVGSGSQHLPVTSPRAGVFGETRLTTASDITDGLSNTMAVADVGAGFGPWASGGLSTVRSLTASPYINGPDGLGGGHGMNVLMADGSVRTLSVATDDKVVQALATIAGGDSISTDAPTGQNPTVASEPQKPARRAGLEWGPNSVGIVFCWCPPGKMPSVSATRAREAAEPPVIRNGFWISKYEITQAQWVQVMKSEPWRTNANLPTQPQFPASNVNWSLAKQFCSRLTSNEAGPNQRNPERTYQLPTELQWEYACRAGTSSRYSYGDREAELGDFCWHRTNSRVSGLRFPRSVGLKRPNPWGLHDMHGNVCEWCEDIHAVGIVKNPKVDLSDVNTNRAIRGGSCIDRPEFCQSATSSSKPAMHHDNFTGFRILFLERTSMD